MLEYLMSGGPFAGLASSVFNQNMAALYPAAKATLIAACGLAGVIFVLRAIHSLSMHAHDPLNPTLSSCIGQFLIGILLVNFTLTIDTFSYTIWNFGAEEVSVFSYCQSRCQGVWGEVDAVFSKFWWFYSLAGLLSVARGLFVWHGTTLGKRNCSFAKGFWHVLGGVIAFHAGHVLNLVKGLFVIGGAG